MAHHDVYTYTYYSRYTMCTMYIVYPAVWIMTTFEAPLDSPVADRQVALYEPFSPFTS